MADRFCETIEELEASLIERCAALCGQPEVIRSYTCYRWWLEAA